jgi:hypothetical protein
MSFDGDIALLRRLKFPRLAAIAARVHALGVLLLGGALAGCSAGDGPGALLVDPGRYEAYHCNDLAARAKVLATREKELRGLMERADQGGGGAVIGSLAYRPEYDSVLGEEKLLQRTAAEKNCNPTQQFQSDQVIR